MQYFRVKFAPFNSLLGQEVQHDASGRLIHEDEGNETWNCNCTTVQPYNCTTGPHSKNIDIIWSWFQLSFLTGETMEAFAESHFHNEEIQLEEVNLNIVLYCTITVLYCTDMKYWGWGCEVCGVHHWGGGQEETSYLGPGDHAQGGHQGETEHYHTSWHVMLFHIMLCHVMLCHIMSCHVMSFHIMKLVSAGGHRGGGVEDPAWHGDDGGPQTRGQPPHGVARGGLIQVQKIFQLENISMISIADEEENLRWSTNWRKQSQLSVIITKDRLIKILNSLK